MVVARIEKPDCSPLLFAEAGTVINKVVFNITFANESEAVRFTSKFSKYAPSIVCSMSGEASAIRDGGKLPAVG
jgi:hypothetical protein